MSTRERFIVSGPSSGPDADCWLVIDTQGGGIMDYCPSRVEASDKANELNKGAKP